MFSVSGKAGWEMQEEDMFRNFTTNGRTYRISAVINNIAFAFISDLESGHLTDANRARFLNALAVKLGTDARTAFHVARAMHLRAFLHYPINDYLNGPAYRRAVDAIGYVSA